MEVADRGDERTQETGYGDLVADHVLRYWRVDVAGGAREDLGAASKWAAWGPRPQGCRLVYGRSAVLGAGGERPARPRLSRRRGGTHRRQPVQGVAVQPVRAGVEGFLDAQGALPAPQLPTPHIAYLVYDRNREDNYAQSLYVAFMDTFDDISLADHSCGFDGSLVAYTTVFERIPTTSAHSNPTWSSSPADPVTSHSWSTP